MIHELVKVKLSGGDKDERQAQIDVLSGGTQAEKIHQIGHVVVLFRRNADEPKIALPATQDGSVTGSSRRLSVRASYRRNSITLIDRELTRSFLLAPDQPWSTGRSIRPPRWTAGHVDALLALKPDLVHPRHRAATGLSGSGVPGRHSCAKASASR